MDLIIVATLPVRCVVMLTAIVILSAQNLVCKLAAYPRKIVAVLMSAVIAVVRFVVLQVIAAVQTPASLHTPHVVVRLPAALPVSRAVMLPPSHIAVKLDIAILMAVTAVHLNIQYLVQVT